MTIPVNISLLIQKYLKKLNFFILEAEDEFVSKEAISWNFLPVQSWHLTWPVIMQIRKMADYNLLLVAIPEDTRKSEPINQKNKLKTLLWYDF